MNDLTLSTKVFNHEALCAMLMEYQIWPDLYDLVVWLSVLKYLQGLRKGGGGYCTNDCKILWWTLKSKLCVYIAIGHYTSPAFLLPLCCWQNGIWCHENRTIREYRFRQIPTTNRGQKVVNLVDTSHFSFQFQFSASKSETS